MLTNLLFVAIFVAEGICHFDLKMALTIMAISSLMILLMMMMMAKEMVLLLSDKVMATKMMKKRNHR